MQRPVFSSDQGKLRLPAEVLLLQFQLTLQPGNGLVLIGNGPILLGNDLFLLDNEVYQP